MNKKYTRKRSKLNQRSNQSKGLMVFLLKYIIEGSQPRRYSQSYETKWQSFLFAVTKAVYEKFMT